MFALCVLFNFVIAVNSKLTSIAKNILKLCKQEMAEVENCPDCYNFAYTNDENFFIKVCVSNHLGLYYCYRQPFYSHNSLLP